MDVVPALARWLHFMAGIMWVGLLYYFNFVQMAALKSAAADGSAAAINRHVTPPALAWFRWASVATWLTGAALLGKDFAAAFTLQPSHFAIGIGAWLGTIMLFNVWALLWPAQKVALGLVEATEAQKGAARRRAFIISRLNLALTFPLLFFMGAAGHTAIYF
ncbi:MAG: urate hydroxylase PuuD [Burkholderiales bacterium]|nr:urate hydroxylase PuuD [Burkholderiales bacterium]